MPRVEKIRQPRKRQEVFTLWHRKGEAAAPVGYLLWVAPNLDLALPNQFGPNPRRPEQVVVVPDGKALGWFALWAEGNKRRNEARALLLGSSIGRWIEVEHARHLGEAVPPFDGSVALTLEVHGVWLSSEPPGLVYPPPPVGAPPKLRRKRSVKPKAEPTPRRRKPRTLAEALRQGGEKGKK